MEIKNRVRIRLIIWPPDKGLSKPVVICEGDDRVPFFIFSRVGEFDTIIGEVPSHSLWEENASPINTPGTKITLISIPYEFGTYIMLTGDEDPPTLPEDEEYMEISEEEMHDFTDGVGGL